MAVAATCGLLPKAMNVSPKAAVCSALKPKSFACAPARVMTSTISLALAAVLSDKWLSASPSLDISVIGMPKIFDSFAIDSPA